jgi:glucan-binding YG repeat protein
MRHVKNTKHRGSRLRNVGQFCRTDCCHMPESRLIRLLVSKEGWSLMELITMLKRNVYHPEVFVIQKLKERITTVQHNSPTQHSNTTVQHKSPTQHSIPTQQSNTILQHKSPTQNSNTTVQHKSPTQHSNTTVQHNSPTQHYNTTVQHITTQQPNTTVCSNLVIHHNIMGYMFRLLTITR